MEDARIREGSAQQSIIQSPEVSNGASLIKPGGMQLNEFYFFIILILEVGLNMMGLSVSETPLISPSPKRIVRIGGDTNMVNSY